MKNLVVALLVILSLGMLSSCSEEDILTSDQATIVNNDQLTLPDLKLMNEPNYTEADLTKEYALNDDGMPAEIENSEGEEYVFFGKRRVFIKHLFDTLQLTAEQRIKAAYVINEYVHCKMQIMLQLRKMNMEIITKANQARMDVLFKYNNGFISYAEMILAFSKINEEVRKAFYNDPVRKALIAKLINCHNEFIYDLRLILSTEQWNKLVYWYNHRFGQSM